MKKQKIRYILLAKSVPEFDKRDNKLYTCSLGYSHELGLIRVYPLPVKGMKKWGIYEIEVEKNKRDTRKESWKLSSYARFENWKGLNSDCKYLGDVSNSDKIKIINFLQHNTYPSISQLNKDRRSVGVVVSDTLNPHWKENGRFIDTNQVGMFEDVELASFTQYTKETKEKEARIIFKDGDGLHNLQLNEWQFYEYQRKFGAKNDAFRHINFSNKNILLLGNMLQYQNNWMVLGIFKPVNQYQLLF